MDKRLRIIAGAIVTESKLSKEAKVQLLNFIQKEASDIQIKALLLDGKILPKIDEQTEEIINDRFISRESDLVIAAGGAAMVGLIVAGIASEINKIRKRILTKAGRACKSYTGDMHSKCVNKFKKESLGKELQLLQRGKEACKKSKDPKKCIASLDKKIIKTKKKYDKIMI